MLRAVARRHIMEVPDFISHKFARFWMRRGKVGIPSVGMDLVGGGKPFAGAVLIELVRAQL